MCVHIYFNTAVDASISSMLYVLSHCVECTWYWHYNAVNG